MEEYLFFKGKDSCGGDVLNTGRKSIEELKNTCNQNERSVGFNTLGFFKNNIDINNLQTSPYYNDIDGIYVNMNRYFIQEEQKKNKSHMEFADYTFFQNKDSPGNDITTITNKKIHELKELCDTNKDAVAFNTFGSFKNKIQDMVNTGSFRSSDGLYVKKQITRIKMTCSWCSGKELCDEWNHMSKGNYRWNDIEITHTDDNIDFYVIINKPNPYEKPYYDPARTIIFHMEPWCFDKTQNWGVKTWGEFAEPDESKYLQVRSHQNFCNNAFWQLKTTWSEFMNKPIKKTKSLSSICSSKYFDPGHIKRIDFIKYIESKNEITIDVWNHDNDHKFQGYMGPHPKGNKDVGIMPYKYYFMGENNEEKNFITEKIWESLLCECLCFYWGCPNISDFVDPRAYVVLDLNDMEKSYEIVKDAIANDLWSQRLEVIRCEKQKVLNYYQFFPTIERVLKHDFKLKHNPTDFDVQYHKYFNTVLNSKVKNVCFIHACTINNNTQILHELLKQVQMIKELDKIFIVNIGDKINIQNTEKLLVINYSKNVKLCEKPTINLMQLFSQYNNSKILYLHTKGITHNPLPNQIRDWTKLMTYCLIDCAKECMDLLTEYDTVGCNYSDKPYPHFSGNFWWSRTSHLKKLPVITSNDRHDSEWWVAQNNPNKYVVHNSNKNHYYETYDLTEYKNQVKNKLQENYVITAPIKCVNLVRRKDRKDYTINLLNKVDMTCDFIEAVDGTTLEVTPEITKMFEGNDFGSRKGFIGCALSHISIWSTLVNDEENDSYIVIEDDVEIDNSFKFQLANVSNKIKNFDYDIVYLGTSIRRANKTAYKNKITDNLQIMQYDTDISIGGTFGYIVNKRGAQKIMDFINANGVKHGIDYLFIKYKKEMQLVQLEVIPHIVHSEYIGDGYIGDSDIQNDHSSVMLV